MPSSLKSLAIYGAILIATASPLPAQQPSIGAHSGAPVSSTHHAGPVMPGNAILVLDPGVDAKGEPHPILRNSSDGGLQVEIPPTIHVHRYYPSGPREFQAQYFAGGPTIVAVRHPYSNERVNVHLDLPAGFPRIKYDLNEIEYKYPEETFSVHFTKCGDVTTSYSRCSAVKLKSKRAAENLKEKCRDCGERLRVNELAARVCQEATELANGSTDRAGQVISHSGNLLITALNIVPGYQLLKSKAEDESTKYRDRAVQRVAIESESAEEDIRTLR